MKLISRIHYWRRIFPAYLGFGKSQLSFWHEVPEINKDFRPKELSQYYMTLRAKADYDGPFDQQGIPLLDYRGRIGPQYNPIAIAQYGLGNYNLFRRAGDPERRRKFLAVADWLVANLEQNQSGLWVWNHHFDWEYRTMLKAPWYSGLAQGQGISVLVRAYNETREGKYMMAARKALEPFLKEMDEGGVIFTDDHGRIWFEEYIVKPPTHILNGFIWASWGVYDYSLATGEAVAQSLFDHAVETLATNLHRYDAGFWSLYEQSGTWLKMLASPFYHHLHIVQLHILYQLTGREIFRQYAMQWDGYRKSSLKKTAALLYKMIFKLCYY